MRRKALLWATAAFALLVGAAPAAADSTLYLQGTGSVQGARFKNFVVVEPGQPPRGWLSVRGAPVQHATATCTSVTDGAATIGYRIDIGADPGHGWLVSVRYPGGP